MKRMLVLVMVAGVLAAGVFFGVRQNQTSAVKTCRADAQRFSEENDSYEAEYDTLFGATTLAQRPISELLERDDEIMACMSRDPDNREQYRAVLFRNGFIEGTRFFKYLIDTQQLQDFARYERGQQAAQLAAYHEDSH